MGLLAALSHASLRLRQMTFMGPAHLPFSPPILFGPSSRAPLLALLPPGQRSELGLKVPAPAIAARCASPVPLSAALVCLRMLLSLLLRHVLMLSNVVHEVLLIVVMLPVTLAEPREAIAVIARVWGQAGIASRCSAKGHLNCTVESCKLEQL